MNFFIYNLEFKTTCFDDKNNRSNFEQIVHQHPAPLSFFLVAESIDKFMHSEDAVILNLGKSLKWLLCAVSNCTEVRAQ